jgi:TRAP-type C4-dicarboxylate transport system permease small subunit
MEQSFVVVILGLMVLLAFLQVILRNFFSGGFIWGDTLLRHLVLWLGFLGAAVAAEREKHISIDIIGRIVPPRIGILIRIITNFFATIVSFYLAKAGLTFLQSEIETGDTLMTIADYELPAWWFQVIIPVGFALISFHFLLRTIEYVNKWFHRSENIKNGETV